ncbi:MAG: hypothetical protein C0615_00660 [Desulfuromonas sp.]|nr:MAG: hypothetical protein C0615_00660 [Desulfuromonas sp.]
MTAPCHIEQFESSKESVSRALANAGAFAILKQQSQILIKPNLINTSPPPITFPVTLMESLVKAIRQESNARLIIAEGCGDPDLTTDAVFEQLGYSRLAKKYDLELIDLNRAPLRRSYDPACQVFPEIFLPEILFDSFVISAQVLKAHSLAGVTIAMKNMIGCAPPSHYQQGGYWKKSAFHPMMHEAIIDLNRHRAPDLCFVDATIGMAEFHLGGAHCDPPVGKLIVGSDPVAVDTAGATLLGRDCQKIDHIRRADSVLGSAAAGMKVIV